jgi:plasmid replication initiation protein
MTAEAALPDLFRAAYADIPIRDQRDTMERPFFSLAKKPRKVPIEYNVSGVTVKVTPGEYGIATIWDADILIWAATQITEALDRDGKASRTIHFHPYQLLKGIRRHHGGDQYRKLLDALRRLRTTNVETNIRPARGGVKRGSFGWIDQWTAEEAPDGQPLTMSITLSEWLYEGIIEEGGILSIHEDYFLLTGGIERWLYRVARKHGGRQDNGYTFTMRQLYEKSGSAARMSDFAIDIRKIVKADNLPEYALSVARNEEGEEIVSMIRRDLLHIGDERYELPRGRRGRGGQGARRRNSVYQAQGNLPLKPPERGA